MDPAHGDDVVELIGVAGAHVRGGAGSHADACNGAPSETGFDWLARILAVAKLKDAECWRRERHATPTQVNHRIDQRWLGDEVVGVRNPIEPQVARLDPGRAIGTAEHERYAGFGTELPRCFALNRKRRAECDVAPPARDRRRSPS